MNIHNMAGHLIRRLNQISVSVFQARMKQAGLDLTPVQFAALNALAQYPGLDQARLAGLIAYDKVTIGGVVERLARKGWVVRAQSEADRRARSLHLTKDGAALLARVTPLVQDLQDDILTGLDAEERALFLRLARKAALEGNALSRAPQSTPPARAQRRDAE